jgi:hypothetical protein
MRGYLLKSTDPKCRLKLAIADRLGKQYPIIYV